MCLIRCRYATKRDTTFREHKNISDGIKTHNIIQTYATVCVTYGIHTLTVSLANAKYPCSITFD